MTALRLALVALVASSGVAFAQAPSAAQVDEDLKTAKAHFDLQEYAAAEASLRAAYLIDPRPDILYAIAQAQRAAGSCDKAITTYKTFLRTNPPADKIKVTDDNIRRCEEELAGKPPEPTPPPKPTPAPKPPPPPPEHHVSWLDNRLGHGLALGGFLGGAIGVGMFMYGQAKLRDINSAAYYDDFVARSRDASTAKTVRTIGVLTTTAGLATIGLAVYVYVHGSERTERTATVGVGPRGEVTVAWGF